jgi:hypothetical protein
MARLHPIPSGAGVLLVPDFCNPPLEERRIVRPTRRKGGKRA